MKLTALFLCFLSLQSYAQEWESIETPITSNLILFGIDFPEGQNEIGYTGGSSTTFNGQGILLKTTDSGLSWEVIWSSTTNGSGITSLYFSSSTTGMVGRMDGSLMTTTDGGVSWDMVDFDPGVDQGEVRAIQFYDALNGAMICGWEGIYTTSDGGATWTQATTNFFGGQSIAYADANHLFACGGSQTIYESEDGGTTWNQVFQGPNANMQWVNLGIAFYDAMNGIVTSEEGQIFITSDGGDTWSTGAVDGQFGLMRGIHYVSLDDIYISATPGAVYVTDDGGQNWELDSEVDFNPSYYEVIFTDNGTGYVCGSGSNGGTILRKEPTVGITELNENTLIIYPNPSQEFIKIESHFNNYQISLIDITGKEVLNAVPMGNQVNISELPNGTYAVLLTDQNGNSSSTRLIIER